LCYSDVELERSRYRAALANRFRGRVPKLPINFEEIFLPANWNF
jgi:hypothetical protein